VYKRNSFFSEASTEVRYGMVDRATNRVLKYITVIMDMNAMAAN